jgi:adenylate kinase family enzyme
MEQQTTVFFFLGQSGAGKGTQVKKVLEWLKSQNKPVLYVAMGDEVRRMIQKLPEDNFFKNNMKHIDDKGELQPPAFPLHFFLNKFIYNYKPGQIIIIDGSPRSLKEFELWSDLVIKGYLPTPNVINIDVSDEECIRRLKKDPRDRTDTQKEESLKTKLDWYKSVRSLISAGVQGFRIVTVNGEQSESDVFTEIKQKMIHLMNL